MGLKDIKIGTDALRDLGLDELKFRWRMHKVSKRLESGLWSLARLHCEDPPLLNTTPNFRAWERWSPCQDREFFYP
jgi:hypothetical protein